MRKICCLLGAVLLLLTGIPALADSINPVSVGAMMAPGDWLRTSKIVTISAGTPTSSKVDVFFLSDTTGSMGSYIGAVAASAGTILANSAPLGDVNWGVGEYKDFTDSYAYRLNQAVTSSQADAQAGINMWVAGGGADYQEANLYALNTLATSGATGWRAGSARILVWMGDASGHDPSGGVNEATATASLVAGGIKALAVDVGTMNDTGQAGRIAAATGGALYTGIDSASIVAAIQAAITTSFLNYSTVGLDLSEAPAGVGVVAVPGSFVGAFNRSIERTFNFDVTFTGVSEGDYTFNIYATVDGGRVATEADHIVVTAIPEPGSIVLLGTIMLGVATAINRRRRLV